METPVKPLRQQRSEAEIRTLLSEHEKSDFTIKEFCELYEISEQTFYNWRNKYSPKIEKDETFIPLSIPVSASSLYAEIELPGKAIIRLFQPLDAAIVKALL